MTRFFCFIYTELQLQMFMFMCSCWNSSLLNINSSLLNIKSSSIYILSLNDYLSICNLVSDNIGISLTFTCRLSSRFWYVYQLSDWYVQGAKRKTGFHKSKSGQWQYTWNNYKLVQIKPEQDGCTGQYARSLQKWVSWACAFQLNDKN